MSSFPTTLPPPPESDANLLAVKCVTRDNLHKLNSLLCALETTTEEPAAPEALNADLEARLQGWLEEHYGGSGTDSEEFAPSVWRDERPTERVPRGEPTAPAEQGEVSRLAQPR